MRSRRPIRPSGLAPARPNRAGSRFWRRAVGLAVAVATGVASLVAIPAGAPGAAAAGDPVIAAAGDIACDPLDTSYDAGLGNGGACMQQATANLLVGHGYSAVLSLGDNQYYCGSLAAYRQAYADSWGKLKSITHPVPGNHEYLTSGGGIEGATGCDQSNFDGAGYFGYFGSAAGQPGQGYYSFDIGAWHLIALNSSCATAGGCGATSPQGRWLVADLAAHPNQCTLAYWHIPLFSSGGRASPNTQFFWDALYAAHADLVLNGHDHIYERFAPQTPAAAPDPVNGITQITVGTGGANHTAIASIAANSVVRNTDSFGILALTLHGSSYSWKFQRATGSFTDSGSASCHTAPAAPTATPRPTRTPRPTPSPRPSPTVVPAAGATYKALTPTRLLDTRFGVGLSGPFGSLVARTFQVTGAVVPSNAVAVTGNLTVTGQTTLGYLYLGPAPIDRPTSSTLNFPPGDDRANAVTVALGAGGTLSATFAAPSLGATANVIFDVTGYFVPDSTGSTYMPLTPARLLDSRMGIGLAGSFASHRARTIQVTGSVVPSGAVAVTGNLTVTGQTSAGFLYAGPTPQDNPTSSTLNFPLGDDRANALTVALGPGGSLAITYAGPPGAQTQAIFDVTGYFMP
jgi:hypothetical protein